MYMKGNKALHTIGIILGIAIIAAGVWFALSPAYNNTGSHTRSASFGADFYTLQYEATQNAANNVMYVNSNFGYLFDQLALYVGALFIAIGALTVINHACKLSARPVEIAFKSPNEAQSESAYSQRESAYL